VNLRIRRGCVIHAVDEMNDSPENEARGFPGEFSDDGEASVR
jgi:hypothetical protein